MKNAKGTIAFSLALGLLLSLFWGLNFLQQTVQAAPTSTTHFVSPDGNNSDTCDDWANACDLQTALGDAISGDEVWVRQGVYKPTTTSDRAISFPLISGVALYGGFNGTESSREERDPLNNLTVLSGDIDDNDTTDPNGVVTDTANILGTNSYHVVVASGVDAGAVVDGFTITAGKTADYISGAYCDVDDCGGGMYNNNGSNPTLNNVTFSGNAAYRGGGMFNNNGSSPTLTEVTFIRNSTIDDGAGLYNLSSSNPTLAAVTFSDNAAGEDGGGILNYSSSPTLSDVTFSGNTAIDNGGGMQNWDGSSPTLSDVTFSGNTAIIDGGGMYNDGSSNPFLTTVTFLDNSASDDGGGMYNMNSNPTLNDVIFSGNAADDKGGGMGNDGSSPTLSNVIFFRNTAVLDGGGMYNYAGSNPSMSNVTFSNNTADSHGGGMYNNGSSPELTNITFYDNTGAVDGGAIYNLNSSPELTNGIVWGNTPLENQIYNNSSTTAVSYSDIEGGYTGTGNINANPQLVSQSSSTPPNNLRLNPGSPAIDAGDNAAITGVDTDLDGSPRFVDIPSAPDTGSGGSPIVDMGAYEAQVGSPIIYVDQDAPGPIHDGTSWEDAFTGLQPALAAANADNEIWIADGVYYPGIPGNTGASFMLKDGIELYGGFNGTESGLEERDPANNLTVLSGDIDDNDTTDPNGVVTDTANILGTNSYHVVVASGVDDGARLDGFTITAGKTAEDTNSILCDEEDCGGGIYFESSNPFLCNMTFSGNAADFGGGIYNDYSNPTLFEVTFSGNTADFGGGGMFNFISHPHLLEVTFSNNAADYNGGGIYSRQGHLHLTKVTFSDNAAGEDGGGMFNTNSVPTLFEVTFSDNAAGMYGGGMYLEYGGGTLIDVTFSDNAAYNGGGMYNVFTNPTLSEVTFSGNTADFGGGMYNSSSSPTLSEVTFSGNTADQSGGGMFNSASSPELVQTRFFSNTASTNGGGIYNASGSNATLVNVAFSGNQAESNGGGIVNASSSLTLTHVTLAHNQAWNWGGGIYNDDAAIILTLQNSLIWGNTGTMPTTYENQVYSPGPTPVTSFTTIQDDDEDPSPFLDADGVDNITGTLDDDLRPTYPSEGIIDGGKDSDLPLDTYDLDGDGDHNEQLPIDLNGFHRIYADYDLDGNCDPVQDLNQVDQGAYEAQYGWYMTYGDDRLSAGREYRTYYHVSQTISDTLAAYSITPFQTADQSYLMAAGNLDTPPGFTLADIFPRLLDIRWEIATGELLAGNDDMVKSMDMRFNEEFSSLDAQIVNTIAARDHYKTAVDAYLDLLGVSGYYTRTLNIQPTRLSYLDVDNPVLNPYHDVQRLAGAMAKESEAALKLAQSYFRQYTEASKGLAEDTLWDARNLAADRLALLDDLVEDWVGAWDNTAYATAYQAMTQNIADMERISEFLQQGKNPFGYNPGYIPFMIRYDNSANPEDTWNFINVYEAAYLGDDSYFDDANESYRTLLSAQRDLDDNQGALEIVLGELIDEYQGPLGDLCGYVGDDLDLAGCLGGTIKDQVYVIQGAILRLRQADVEMSNQLELIRIEQQRAADVAGIHIATAVMYEEDGTTLATLASDEANLLYCKSDEGVALDMLGEFTDVFIEGDSTNFTSMGAYGFGAVKSIIQYGKNMEERRVAAELADIAAQREEIYARQKAHVEYAEAQIVDANSEALVKKYMLEYATLKLDRAIAFNDLQQALHRLNAMTSQVEYLLARWAEAKRTTSELYMDPGARLYRDWLSEVTQDYYDLALEWAFRTSRALDYEMGEPWGGADGIFEIMDINNLELAYTAPDTGMKDTFDDWKAPIPPEPEYDTIPVSQAMGFVDSCEIVDDVEVCTTAREKFNAYVSDPDNWVDLNNDSTAGSLRLTFQTSIFDSEPFNLFSLGVYNDKILRTAPVLIGDEGLLDSAGNDSTIRIKQLGTCFLRRKDAEIGGQDSFSAYDFENVFKEEDSSEARLTSYHYWINDNNLEHTEIDSYGSLGLLWRSVGCTEWVLTIAKEGIDAKNNDMDFSALDDILLYVKHRSFPLETPASSQALASPDLAPEAAPRLLVDAESAYRYYGSLFPESPEFLSPIELSMYLEQSGSSVEAVIEPAGLLAFPEDTVTGLGPELYGTSVDWALNLTSEPFPSAGGISRTLSLTTTAVLSDGLQISGVFLQSITGLVSETLQVQGVFTLTRATEAPVAAFGANPSLGPVPLAVQFSNWSQGEPSSYLWDFGDGNTSTEVEPTHIYTQTGTYTVTLTVESLHGSDTLVEVDYITVIDLEYKVYLPILMR